MARKSFNELISGLLVSFPDNTTGAITPAILRTYFQSFLEAIRPAYCSLTRVGPVVQPGITAVDVPLIFDSSFISEVPDYTAQPASGAITRVEKGTTSITFNISVEGAINRIATFTLYKNGVATSWRTSATLQGVGKPIDTSLYTLSYDAAQATYSIRVKVDAGIAVDLTVSNLDLLAMTVPVNAY